MSNNKSLDGFNRINNVVLNNTEVNGLFTPHNNQLIDIGTSIKKFNNIYANDIVLSSGSVISDLNSLQSQINNITNATSGGLDVIATNGDFINITTDNLVVSSITSSSILTNNIDSINSTIDNILSSNITSTNALITNVSTPNLRFSNYINPIFVTQGSYGVKVNGLTIILNTKGELATNNSNFLISKPFLSGITPKQEPVSVGKLTEVLDLIGLTIEDLSDLLGIDQDILSDMQTIGLNVDTNQFKFKSASSILDPLGTKLALKDDNTTPRRALFFDENSGLKTNNYLKISDTAQYDGKYIELSSVTITDAKIDTTNIKTTNLTSSNFKVEEVTASNLLVNTKLKTLELQVDGDTNIQANTTISNLYTSNITSGNLTATSITTGGLSLTNLISNSFTSSNIRTENITASNIFVNTKLQTLELEVDGNCKIDSNTTISNLTIPQNLIVSGSGSIGSLVVPNSFNSQAVSITGGARLTNIGTGLEYSGNNLQIKLNAGTGISVSGNTITNDLNDDVTTLKSDMTTVKADITGIKGVNTTQDTALAVLAAFQATQTLVVNTEFGARISNCETSIGNLKTQVDNYGSSIGSLNTSVGNLKTQVDNYGSSIGSLNTSVGNLKTQVDNYGSSIGSLNTSVGNLKTQVDNYGSSIGSLNTSVGSLKTQVDNYGSSIGSLNTSVGSLKTQVDNYGSSIGSLNTSVGSLKTQVDNYGSSIGSLNTSMGSLKTQVDNYGNSIGSLNTSVGNLTTKVNGYQTSFSTSNLLATNATVGNIFTTGGNVGINITSPSYRLDVGGDINLTGNYYKNGVLFSSGGESVWGTSGSNIFYTKGNVGIGTTSPSYLLHVSGGSAFGGLITSSSIAVGNSITTGYTIINNEEVKINLTHPTTGTYNNTDLYELSASSEYMGLSISNLFDGNTGGNPWASDIDTYTSGNYIGSVTTGTNLGTYNGEWFGFRLKNDTFVLNNFSLYSLIDGDTPVELIVLGNNVTTGTIWDVITTLGNLNFPSDTTTNVTISNTLSYSNYRFVIPKKNSDPVRTSIILYEFSLGGYRRYTTTINGGITTGFINVSGITAGNINITGLSNFVGISAGSINISGASVFSTGITGGSINITGASSFGVGITGGSINITGASSFGVGISGGSINMSGASALTFNSNTIGNIVTTGGNVGIGVVSPKTRLHLEGESSSINGPHITFTTSADTTYPVFQQVAWARDATYLLFDSYMDNTGIIRASSTKTAYQIGKYADRLLFNYRNASAGSASNSYVGIAICSTGNVGIGLNTASYKLDVLGTSNFSDLITASTLSILIITSGNIISNIGITGGSLNISGASNFGVGITGGSLNITGSSSFGGVITASNLSINNITVANLNATALSFNALTIGNLRVTGESSLVFNSNTVGSIITTGGNVGIGGTPTGGLHVILPDANANSSVTGNTSTWGNTYAVFGQSNNTGGAVGIGYHSNSGGSLSCLSPSVSWRSMSYLALQHRFFYSNTEALRINTAGNVGIGTMSPSYPLDVSGASRLGGTIFGASGTNTGYIEFYTAGSSSRTGYIGYGTSTISFDIWGEGARDIRIATNNTERIRITSSGNFGIGTSNPSGAKCHIDGSVSGSPGTSRRYTSSGQDASSNNWTGINMSLRTSDAIWSKEIFLTSDSRIKTNIQDLDDLEALTILRQLKPKRYSYKDTIMNGENQVYGFIAQEVAEVLDYSVDLKSEYIPNIYQLCSIGNNIITSSQPMNITNITSGKLKIYYPFNETEKEVNVNIVNIIDSYTVAIEPLGLTGGNVFVYGELVNDFNILKKDAIWTIATASLQEIDRELQATNSRIETLESENKRLVDFIKSKYPDEF